MQAVNRLQLAKGYARLIPHDVFKRFLHRAEICTLVFLLTKKAFKEHIVGVFFNFLGFVS